MKRFIAMALVLSLGIPFATTHAQDFGEDTRERVGETAAALSAKKRNGGLGRKLAGALLACGVLASACAENTTNINGCQWVDRAFANTAESVQKVAEGRLKVANTGGREGWDAIKDSQAKSNQAREALKRAEEQTGACDQSHKQLFITQLEVTLSDVEQSQALVNSRSWDGVRKATLFVDAAAAKIEALKDQAKTGTPSASFPPSGTCIVIGDVIGKAKGVQEQLTKALQLAELAVKNGESTVNARIALNKARLLFEEAQGAQTQLKELGQGNCGQQKRLQEKELDSVLSNLDQQEKALRKAVTSKESPDALGHVAEASRLARETLIQLEVLRVELQNEIDGK